MRSLYLTLAATSAAICLAPAEPVFTKPVGYTTQTLIAGQYNLIGLTLHESTISAGDFETVQGTTLTDSDIDFTQTLTAGATYILEIEDGNLAGTIQEITSWNGNQITTPQDISSLVIPNSTSYKLRKAKTLSDVFGVNNSAGLVSGVSVAVADVIWIPNGGGSFLKYFYHPGSAFPPVSQGWKRDGVLGANAGNTPIVYSDGILIQKRSSNLNLTIAGEVKTKSTVLYVEGNGSSLYNYVSGTFPAGSTLDSSGLKDHLLRGNGISTADVVWMPNGAGYDKFYYTNGTAFPPVSAGWKNSSGVASGSRELTSGFIIQRRGATINATLSPPTSYSNL